MTVYLPIWRACRLSLISFLSVNSISANKFFGKKASAALGKAKNGRKFQAKACATQPSLVTNDFQGKLEPTPSSSSLAFLMLASVVLHGTWSGGLTLCINETRNPIHIRLFWANPAKNIFELVLWAYHSLKRAFYESGQSYILLQNKNRPCKIGAPTFPCLIWELFRCRSFFLISNFHSQIGKAGTYSQFLQGRVLSRTYWRYSLYSISSLLPSTQEQPCRDELEPLGALWELLVAGYRMLHEASIFSRR